MCIEVAGAFGSAQASSAVRQESTGVHFGVDRSEADGIDIFGPESTNPPMFCPSENTPISFLPPSSKTVIDVN